MQFKNLAEEMTEKDLKEVLEIIYPDTIFSGYKRMEREIKIFFKLHHLQSRSFRLRVSLKKIMQCATII